MLRDAVKKHYFGMNTEFRHRGEEPGRLENFSDAVFALAITLLLISTTPPTNFTQIKRFVYDLIPFLFCIAVIVGRQRKKLLASQFTAQTQPDLTEKYLLSARTR